MLESLQLQKVEVAKERLWSYHDGDKAVEGIPESRLKGLIATGQLKRNTLVWTSGMAYWEKVSDLKTLQPDFNQAPQPWGRFFARLFDMLLYSIVLSIIISIAAIFLPFLDFFLSSQISATVLFSIIVICTMPVPEAFFISAFGTTPAKWICNIWVSNTSGNKLTLSESFSRSIRVMIEGMALGLPLIYLFTMIRARTQLSESGKTAWDRDGGFIVSHGRIGPIRIIAILSLFGLYILDRVLFIVL